MENIIRLINRATDLDIEYSKSQEKLSQFVLKTIEKKGWGTINQLSYLLGKSPQSNSLNAQIGKLKNLEKGKFYNLQYLINFTKAVILDERVQKETEDIIKKQSVILNFEANN